MNSLASQLTNVNTVAIIGHVRPDGDCIGSCMASYNYIDTYYKNIEVDVYLEPIPSIFQFLKNTDKIVSSFEQDKDYDLCIIQDCGSLDRIGDAVKYFKSAKSTICIDHHISNASFADINHIYPDISSTSELIFGLVGEENLTKEIAECIYVGMVHDTGVFQYSSTTSKTMNIAGKLMDTGIDFTKIIDNTFYKKTYAQNQMLGHVLVGSKLYLNNRCIIGEADADTMEALHILPKHLDGIVNQLRVTKGAEVAVFIYQTMEQGEQGYKISMRSNGIVDVASIALKFGGGGHKLAAGATISDSKENIIPAVCREIEIQLDGAL